MTAVRSASRATVTATVVVVAVAMVAPLAGCAPSPADPVPFKPVPPERILKRETTQPAAGLVAVEIRRERSSDVIVRFRDVLVYVDGEQVTDLMNGEHAIFYLTPGAHRLAVSTQFDPVLEFAFPVDARYTNHASIVFDKDHRVGLVRMPK
ncbi:hypothetical protein BWP39_01185 [Paraburkholderia acidicola]|uniref:DUF2846 domain-containing protein n=2 Tax=Paraburkholderia acidicola TaxID=1912599 RepID=A0A2A4F8V6_9BURK|nr:hypothetical protein BWP39_01185 [Paraburkholderia acidicola]